MQPSGAANSNRKGLPKTGWLVSQAETSPTCLIGIDATFAMAKGGGAEIGATKRGKGLKIMAIVDRHGLPLSVSTHAANHHESVLKVRKIPDVITKANYSHAHLRARHSHSKPPLTCLRMYSTGHHLVRGPSRIPKHGRASIRLDLTFDSARTLRACHIVWRTPNEIGVEFSIPRKTYCKAGKRPLRLAVKPGQQLPRFTLSGHTSALPCAFKG